MSSSPPAGLDVKHTGAQRGAGRHGPRVRVITGTGRPLLLERVTEPALFNMIEQRANRLIPLKHDNVVKIFSIQRSEDGKSLDVYTEMTSKLSVRDILNQMGKLDALVVRNYARQILNGLKFLHDHGIYMGGLRHEDILLAGRGKVKISNAHSAIPKGGEPIDDSAAKDDPGRVAEIKKDLASFGDVISDLLKCKRLTADDLDFNHQLREGDHRFIP
eukprot:g2344.t1